MTSSTLQTDLLDSLGSGDPVARIHVVATAELPSPYRDLLDHDRDMTSTLEAHHSAPLRLLVLRKDVSDGFLTREVVLETSAGAPVEYGAIRINLNALPAEPRSAVEAGQVPLGAILERFRVSYSCHPTALFRTSCTDLAQAAFKTEYGGALYGRRNRIKGDRGQLLADVIEILAPARGGGRGS